jgi:hypothetical protein
MRVPTCKASGMDKMNVDDTSLQVMRRQLKIEEVRR